MTPLMKKLILLATTLLAMGCNAGSAGGKATPQEDDKVHRQSLTRTAESGLVLQSNVAKAIYVTESYTETEEYTDYEQECHTSHERVCHIEQDCHWEAGDRQCTWIPGGNDCRWIPGDRQCRTIPGDRQCRQERICQPDRGERQCEIARECGTNSRGEEICKDRKVCHDGPPTERCEYREVCEAGRDREVCEDTPGRQVCESTPGREECYESPGRQVCSPRQVCDSGPRQVCEDIPVRRTREVTRTREIFSHYEYTDVVIRFPKGSELQGEETETFEISIDNDDQAVLRQLSGKNKYRIVSNKRIGQQITIVLELKKEEPPVQKPPVNEDPSEQDEVRSVKLAREKQQVVFSFQDHGVRAGITTKYQLIIKDASRREILARANGTASGQLVQKLSLKEKLESRNYSYELYIHRDLPGNQKDIFDSVAGVVQLK